LFFFHYIIYPANQNPFFVNVLALFSFFMKKSWFFLYFKGFFAWLLPESMVLYTYMKNKNVNTNNMTIVRNVAYSHIKKINKDLKEIIELDDELKELIDINMKNSINKIINIYKAYQATGIMKVN